MKNEKMHVLLTFGGQSSEHDISIISASNIFPYFDPEKYIVHLLYIQENGKWILCDRTRFKVHCDRVEELIPSIQGQPVVLQIVGGKGVQLLDESLSQETPIDVVFSVLHGTKGEDGQIQGLWSFVDIPCTGPNHIGAAVGFDKDVMKRLLREAGLPICKYKMFSAHTVSQTNLDEIKQLVGMPFVVKPANSGSSLGVHKITQDSDFPEAIKDVFRYDDKLMIEEFVDGSELELYCLGVDNEIKTSIIRETIVGSGFYSYEDKYIDEKDVIKHVPARLSDELSVTVQALAKKTYQTLEGRGLARVDLFYSKDGQIFVNEMNTIPCFMSHANQPPLWEMSGVTHQQLVDLTIKAAFQTFHKSE